MGGWSRRDLGSRALPTAYPQGPQGGWGLSDAETPGDRLGQCDEPQWPAGCWRTRSDPRPRWQRGVALQGSCGTPTGPPVPLPWSEACVVTVVLGEQRGRGRAHTVVAIGEAGGQVVDNAGGVERAVGLAARARSCHSQKGRKQAQKSSTIPRMR